VCAICDAVSVSAATGVADMLRGGRPRGWLWYGGWLLSGVLDYVAVVAMYNDSSAPFSPYWAASRVLTAVSLEVTGLWLWRRQPDNRIGPVLLLSGLTGMLAYLTFVRNPAALIVGFLAFQLKASAVAHAVLAFPDGRLHTRSERIFVWSVYGVPVLLNLCVALVSGAPRLSDCRQPLCTRNPVLIRLEPALAGRLVQASLVATATLAVMLFVLLTRRSARLDAQTRRAYRPVLAAMVLVTAAYIANGFQGGLTRRSTEYAILASAAILPLAMAFALTRARADVAVLLARLESCAPERMWDELADALGDPTLRVALRRPGGDFVDPDGRPVDVDDPTQARTVIDPDTILLHDSALLGQTSLLRAGATAARMGLDNRRLQAEVRARLLEVQQSRNRLAQAALDERRRIERDLHDGAQQRLIAVGLNIDQARQYVDDDPAATKALDEAANEVVNTLSELRQLARGLRPALLEERGLAGALPVLVQRLPLPVRLNLSIDVRLPQPVEATAYFVISEGLQNAVKHARATRAEVSVEHHAGRLDVRVADDGVGGADPSRGTGLRGIADRVAALGGTFTVSSPPGVGTTVLVVLAWAVGQDA
jgi:signal transduction histidine kinase